MGTLEKVRDMMKIRTTPRHRDENYMRNSGLQFLTLLCGGMVLIASAHAQYPGAQPVPADLKIGFNAVKPSDSKRILTYLASKCDGRGTGQKGFEKAAKFVAGEFKRIGLNLLQP